VLELVPFPLQFLLHILVLDFILEVGQTLLTHGNIKLGFNVNMMEHGFEN